MSQPPSGTPAPVEEIHWPSLIAAIAAISAVGIAIGLGLPLLSIIMEKRGISSTMIGLNSAMAGLASMAAATVTAKIAPSFRRRQYDAARHCLCRDQRTRLLLHPEFLAVVSAGASSFTVPSPCCSFSPSSGSTPQPPPKRARARSRHLWHRPVAWLCSRAPALLHPRQRGYPAVRLRRQCHSFGSHTDLPCPQ